LTEETTRLGSACVPLVSSTLKQSARYDIGTRLDYWWLMTDWVSCDVSGDRKQLRKMLTEPADPLWARECRVETHVKLCLRTEPV